MNRVRYYSARVTGYHHDFTDRFCTVFRGRFKHGLYAAVNVIIRAGYRLRVRTTDQQAVAKNPPGLPVYRGRLVCSNL